MAGDRARRWATCALALLILVASESRPAGAVEAFDGRIQLHGFYEMQVRGLNRDFAEEIDLAQWYHVINLELEFDILPDGWGPFDLLQAYVRAEGRYDCIYVSGCGMFPSVNTFGNDSQDLPLRLRDAVDDSWAGTIDVNEFETPPGLIPLVPVGGPDSRDPVPWGLLVLGPTPLGDKGLSPPDTPDVQRNRDPCFPADELLPGATCPRKADDEFVRLSRRDDIDATNNPNFFDPSIPNFVDLSPYPDGSIPDPSLGNRRSYFNYCSVNYLPSPTDGRLTCVDNRPESFEVAKRQGFPGFDTLFDQGGADREIGDNQDFASVANLDLDDPGLIDDADFEPGELNSLTSEQFWDPDGAVPDGNAIRLAVTQNLPFSPGGRTQKSDRDLFRDALYGPLFRGIALLRDDPAFYTFETLFDWRFTFRSTPGGDGGAGRTLPMGPWLPKNFFDENAALADRANPLRGRRTPTYIFSEVVADPLADRRGGAGEPPVMNQDSRRLGGIRYHILDNDTLDDNGNRVRCAGSETLFPGATEVDCDPLDQRVLKVEALTLSLRDSGLGSPTGGAPGLAPYPNNPFLESRFGERFGGDFSGIIPCFPTSTELRVSAGAGNTANPRDFSQQLLGRTYAAGCIPYTNVQVSGGNGELPFRAAPDRSNLLGVKQNQAQGIFFPSAGLVRSFRELEYDSHEFNISQIDRSFNRGASQRDTYELKEAYADMEFFDSRLWIRAGLQNIVWGKTELFRTTDQFNPQDLALASLPSLEESRIALLSARAVWSFYDVGPLEDVRLEVAANFDRFKPADLGACGEPYTIDLICGLTLGTAIHSVTGIGVSGFDRPPAGYEDINGVEFGGRIEFRWDRFSFAITDFYGYNDFPYPEAVFFYDRRIDLSSGRPIKALGKGSCINGAGILVQNPFRNPVAAAVGDDAFNQGVTKILHAGTPRQYDRNDPTREQHRTTGERPLAPNELYANGNTIYDNGQPFPNNPVRLTDPREELARVGANDDYWRSFEASTILGSGVDPDCLKPGGPAGGPSENRFDVRKYATISDFPRYSNANTDEATDELLVNQPAGPVSGDGDTFINATYGQWSRDGFSVDPALALHPANQQLFHFICSGTVGIAVALAPSACAWNLFGVSSPFLVGADGQSFTEVVSTWLAGEPSFPDAQALINTVVGNTKSGITGTPGGTVAFVSLNSDIRDGRTDAMGAANNDGGANLANYTRTGSAQFSTGRWAYDDCPGATRVGTADVPSELVRGTCLKSTARDPWDYLGLGNTLTMEQKALLGCGPFFGTRCGNSERVVAVRYELQDSASSPQINDSITGVPLYAGVPSTIDIRQGTYDVAGVGFARQALEAGTIRPVKLDAVGKAAPDPDDYCDLDELDECTVFGESGGLDFLNMEGNVIIQSVPGVEGTTLGGFYEGAPNFAEARTWVPGKAGDARTYSLDPQPGTIGIPGLKRDGDRIEEPIPFRGGALCTRYDPGNPLADESGIVKLPGCRGAQEVVINDDLQTVDVVFERGYTPRQDGCIFQRAIRLANDKLRLEDDGSTSVVVPGNSFYYVRPVIKNEFRAGTNDQLLDVDLANELAETCWNGGAYANIMGADIQFLPNDPRNVWRDDPDNPGQKLDPMQLQPIDPYVDKLRYEDGDIGSETVRNPRQYDPTFFSYTRRLIECPRGNDFGTCRLANVQLPETSASISFVGLPTAAPFRIRNSRVGVPGRDERVGTVNSPVPGRGLTNVNELFHLSNSYNANESVTGGPNGTTSQSIIGAGTLFHPFAMCSVATFRPAGAGSGAGQQRWEDPELPGNRDTPLACNYRVRDYENDLLNQRAQVFQNELAAISWNFMTFLVSATCNNVSGTDDVSDPDCYDPDLPWATDRCSFSTPHLCRNVKGFLAVNGVGRNDVRAGGNPRFGRRQFIWHSGGEVALRYKRRNVFGFSTDFAEDVTKTNWGMEFTYIGKVPFVDNDSFSNVTDSSAVNLTVSVDRPTFINFLNANRTFFMNTQWFFQYLPKHESNFTAPGPFNTLFTFAVFTGYYQDRLLPQFVSVYDFRTQSGGFLPQLSYRFTEAFSMTFGVSWFIGKNDYVTMPVNGIAPETNRAGRRAYQNGNQQLLNLIRRRDEAFLRLRWTF